MTIDGAGTAFVFDKTTGQLLQQLANPVGPDQPGFGIALAAVGDAAVIGVGGGEHPHTIVPGEAFLFTPCGDGTLDSGEQCDDGNTQDGDGCSATCEIESSTTSSISTKSSTSTSIANDHDDLSRERERTSGRDRTARLPRRCW
jgi:cysteine-rich repeat protein